MTPLIQVNHLKKKFPSPDGTTYTALHDVSFELFKGETLGLIGESGSGKTTLARCLLRLEIPTEGTILVEGKNLLNFSRKELFSFRRQAQIVFQNPFASLNPRMTVEELIAEPLKIHNVFSNDKNQIFELLEWVGLSPTSLGRFPHEFSGGQCQRIAIARVLALKPQFIILDEPTSFLDVSIQAQIVNLLKKLQSEFNLTYLFISHDRALVNYLSDRIATMTKGVLSLND